MSKLNIETYLGKKIISFVSLNDGKNIYESDIIVGNDEFRLVGKYSLNLSFNSKNCLLMNADSTNVFEFSNNDYVDLENCKFKHKSIKKSYNVTSIIGNGVSVENSYNVFVNNSKNVSINESERLTLINTDNVNIERTEDSMFIGKNLDVYGSENVLIIGKDDEIENSNNTLIIGFNVNSNKNNQILIGNFDNVVPIDHEISIANKGNAIYTSDGDFHIGKDIVLNDGLYRVVNKLDNNNRSIILGVGEFSLCDNSILLGENCECRNLFNSIVVGDGSVYDREIGQPLKNNVIGGEKNIIKNTEESIIFGSKNNVSTLSSTLILGNSNLSNIVRIPSYKGDILAGNSNTIGNGGGNSILVGENNELYGVHDSFISGNNNLFPQLWYSIVIGNNFRNYNTKWNDFSYSYIISDYGNSLIFTQDKIYIGLHNGITYVKFYENIKKFDEIYSKVEYSLISKDKRVNTYNDDGGVQYFKMKSDGFCNLYVSNDGIDGDISVKLFVKDNEVQYNVYTNNYDNLDYLRIKYKNVNDDYIFSVSYSLSVAGSVNFSRVLINESSKCEKTNEVTLSNKAKCVGLTVKNLIPTDKDYNITTKILRINSGKFIETKENLTIEEVVCNKLEVPKGHFIDLFGILENKVEPHNKAMGYVKIGDFAVEKELEEGFNYIDILKENYYFTDNDNNELFGMKYKFYTNNPLTDEGVGYNSSGTLKAPILFLKYKDDESKYSYESRYSYFDLQMRKFSTRLFLTLSDFTKEGLKPYLSIASSRYTNSSGSILFNSLEGVNHPYPNDLVLKFRTNNGHGIDFISNYNDTNIYKWGMFANVTFNAMQDISDSQNKLTTERVFDTMEMCRYIAPYSKTSYNYKVKIGDNIKSFEYDNGNDDYGVGRYSLTQNVNGNQSVYIPFVNLDADYNLFVSKYKYNKNVVGIKYTYNFAPKSKNINIIKTIHVFNIPLNLSIRYNDDNDFMKFGFENGDETKYFCKPLFYGVLDFNKTYNFSKISDITHATNNTTNTIPYIPNKVITNNLRYSDYINSGSNYDLNGSFNIDINPRVNITYALEKIS